MARIAEIERSKAPGRTGLAEAVARGYHKLLAYKDEYEVARLYASPAFEKALGEQFESRRKLEFHLAPPLLARRDKETGEPRKMRFGAWMLPVFRLLAKGKGLRGGAFDIFGYSAERKLERQMIADYEKLLDEIAERLTPATHRTAVALAYAGPRHQGLRPHQGAQLQGREGQGDRPAGRPAQPVTLGAEGGGVAPSPLPLCRRRAFDTYEGGGPCVRDLDRPSPTVLRTQRPI